MSKQLIFRVEDDTWSAFDNYCEEAGYKKQQVLEAMLSRFLASAPEDRQAVVEGRPGTFGDIVERLQWANHAFSVSRWSWASSEYKLLAEEAQSMDGVVRFARYRDGYCLIEESIRYREQVLKNPAKDWSTLWKKAEELCRAAIVANRRANVGAKTRFGVLHPVISYNEACSWSFLGQLVVEGSLAKTDKRVSLLAKSAGNLDATKKVWSKFAGDWRRIVSDESRQKIVRDSGTYALQSLRRTLPSERKTSELFDTRWLGELASSQDNDLILLATLPELAKEFADWISSTRNGSEESESVQSDRLLEDYRQHLEHPELVSYA